MEVFRETDTSAFKQRTVTLPTGEKVRRVVRPRFRALLSFLARGGAEAMIAYDLDRADRAGEVTASRSLSAEEYEGWVDWINTITGEQMGTPRKPGERSKGSPLFAEMTINAPKSLSVAAALHPEVSEALDAAQQDALAEIRRWLGQHSVTRVGPRDAREVVVLPRAARCRTPHPAQTGHRRARRRGSAGDSGCCGSTASLNPPSLHATMPG
ncbi:MAG: relaxase domain-containing protein [Beutenbergiaceae bacterium]